MHKSFAQLLLGANAVAHTRQTQADSMAITIMYSFKGELISNSHAGRRRSKRWRRLYDFTIGININSWATHVFRPNLSNRTGITYSSLPGRGDKGAVTVTVTFTLFIIPLFRVYWMSQSRVCPIFFAYPCHIYSLSLSTLLSSLSISKSRYSIFLHSCDCHIHSINFSTL